MEFDNHQLILIHSWKRLIAELDGKFSAECFCRKETRSGGESDGACALVLPVYVIDSDITPSGYDFPEIFID